MRRSDKLTAGSRSAQGGLSLPLTRCGSVGWLALIGSGLFFVLTLLQYGCVLLSGFLKARRAYIHSRLTIGTSFGALARRLLCAAWYMR